MRALTSLALLSVASSCLADREIQVPKGHKLRDGEVRFEYLGVPGEKASWVWLGTGLNTAFEAELSMVREDSDTGKGSFNVSYNLTPPIIDISPGISFGVTDGLNVTSGGRALYLATTFHYGNLGELNQDIPTELTLGFWTKRTGLGFFAVRFPLSEVLSLIAEHDSERLAAGVEVRPVRGLALKTVFETGRTSLGLTLSHRF